MLFILTERVIPFRYGLPLSRLYARYFAGDLELFSYDGYGTSAVLYLQAHPENAQEILPIFHPTSSKKIYEAQLAANDWTEKPKSNGARKAKDKNDKKKAKKMED